MSPRKVEDQKLRVVAGQLEQAKSTASMKPSGCSSSPGLLHDAVQDFVQQDDAGELVGDCRREC